MEPSNSELDAFASSSSIYHLAGIILKSLSVIIKEEESFSLLL
jgi:hypothetical protein